MNITVWNENVHEQQNEKVREVYPEGIHQALASIFKNSEHNVRTATLQEPEHGLSKEVLEKTDVLLWWGHVAHDEVEDHVVQAVCDRVQAGMGLIVLHSGHFSKVFKKLMGTSCDLKWREVGEKERLWVVEPSHPIVAGIDSHIVIEEEEMYGEHFDIPTPEELVFISWFEGGEVFRSGCTYRRGLGKVFYFRPGHETFPTYYNEQIRRVIENAVNWAEPVKREGPTYGNAQPLEEIKAKN
ncbi:ThuA domain-containing protein [Bacillus sp. FJAT-45037]|uniref:ThuA domain-containing protein n=1 Tax=Bacillus sp. FJAT-45037 TaxID=2011007 RepID=UPI000C241490|nr:ThuA domain-containing protein [Bacillus sp. FJAT-45037]